MLKFINTHASDPLVLPLQGSKEGGNISQREFAQLGHVDSSALLLQPQVHIGHRLQVLLASEVAGDLGRALQTHIAHRTIHPSHNWASTVEFFWLVISHSNVYLWPISVPDRYSRISNTNED